MNKYELMVILSNNLPDEAKENLVNKIQGLIEANNGKVESVEKVGTKKYNGEKMRLHDDEVLVMEGIHCLNDKLTSSIPLSQKYKIYISALTVLNIDYFNRISTTDTRLVRRIVRDYQFRGYNAIHTLETWNSVNRGEEKFIYPFQERADSMFNTSLIYEWCVLKKHAQPLLKQITNHSSEYSEAKSLDNLLDYFEDIPDELVPQNSLLREFIGPQK